MHIWIGTGTFLIFLIIPCWVYSSWLHRAENQKFELSCVWGSGDHARSPFWKWKFFCSICERVTSCLSCPLGMNELVWASLLRAFGPEFTVLMFRNMFLPAKGWALGIWWVGYAISPLLLLQKRQYVLKISIKTAINCLIFIFCSSDEHLGLMSSTKPGAGYPCSPFSVNLVIVLSLS